MTTRLAVYAMSRLTNLSVMHQALGEKKKEKGRMAC